MGYQVFLGIGGGLGLLSEYSVCPVGAPKVLGIEFVSRSKKIIKSINKMNLVTKRC
ncbi:hypothetical protein Hanom_Chr04g00337841 [Helianthus anomalus]